MQSELLADVLAVLDVRATEITVLKDLPYGNRCWLVQGFRGDALVLRRYHDLAAHEDLVYEHAVLRHLADHGWVVPDPIGELVHHAGGWWCLTRFVPGGPVRDETTDQRRRRGRDLALLHLALRGLEGHLGQRPGWQAQHTAVSVHTDINWDAALRRFARVHPRLADWAYSAAVDARRVLGAIGTDGLPTLVVHGDFHEGNVHYDRAGLAGVIDFGLTHVDSRPYELAIARTYRAPEAVDAYREALARSDWPLIDVEEAAIEPIHHAFRTDMVAWQLDHGGRVGVYDTAMIERQLLRTPTPPP